MISSISQLVFQKACDYGFLAALKIHDRIISYQELNAHALSIAAALIECGANNEAIGIVGQRKVSSYLGILGILFAGCPYTPINPKYSEARITSIIRDAKIRFLVGDKLDLEIIANVLSNNNELTIKAIILPEGKALNGKNWLDENSIKKVTPLKTPVEVSLSNLAYLLYTSGSTGEPKGVQVAHSNILAFLQNMSAIYKLDPGFRASQTFDFSFDPSVSDMLFTWTNGGVLCILPEEEILLPSEYIRREKITFWNSVPSIAGFMFKMGHLLPGCFPELLNSMFCGEQFPKQIADAWQKAAPNSSVENLYGPTEATIYITRHVYEKKDVNKQFRNSIIPIGQPFPGHKVELIDDSDNLLQKGAVGEIVYKGPQITKGYLNDTSKTNSVFVTFNWDQSVDKWYKSGDLGFYNDENYLECIGRKDGQIKLGGRRIEIGEIEATLSKFKSVHDAIVVSLKDENEVVIGCVAFTMNYLTKDEETILRNECEKYLERVFFPKRIFSIEIFPLTLSGKIDRKALSSLAKFLMSQPK